MRREAWSSVLAAEAKPTAAAVHAAVEAVTPEPEVESVDEGDREQDVPEAGAPADERPEPEQPEGEAVPPMDGEPAESRPEDGPLLTDREMREAISDRLSPFFLDDAHVALDQQLTLGLSLDAAIAAALGAQHAIGAMPITARVSGGAGRR